VIPKTHIADCGQITAENSAIVAHIFEVIAKLTAELGVTDYRVVNNKGIGAGQTVFHLHFHVLGGKTLEGMC
jgi:histidine triad (HIT) family protein